MFGWRFETRSSAIRWIDFAIVILFIPRRFGWRPPIGQGFRRPPRRTRARPTTDPDLPRGPRPPPPPPPTPRPPPPLDLAGPRHVLQEALPRVLPRLPHVPVQVARPDRDLLGLPHGDGGRRCCWLLLGHGIPPGFTDSPEGTSPDQGRRLEAVAESKRAGL